jgi:hypothetical protein
MRKALRATLILAALSRCVLQAQVPDVDQVLQRFVSALGGEKELEKIHTITLRGTIDLPDFNANGTTTEYFQYPDHFAAVTDLGSHGTTKLVYDGKEGWQVDPRNGFSPVTGADLADIQRRAHIQWNQKLHEFYPNVHVIDREVVNGEEAWKLEATLETFTFDFLFSVKTGLLIRFDTDRHVENGTSSVLISDYRPVDKVLFAFGAEQTAGPVKWKRRLSEVKFNDPIDQSVFQKPAKTESK